MPNTAQLLLTYRKELIEGGLNPDLADNLTRDAAHLLITQCGLTVTDEQQPTRTHP